jgi:hypothetical protein
MSETDNLLEGARLQAFKRDARREVSSDQSALFRPKKSWVAASVAIVLIGGLLQHYSSQPSLVDASDREFWDAHMHAFGNAMMLSGPSVQVVTQEVEKPHLKDLKYFNHTLAFDMLKFDRKSTADDFYYYQQGWEAQITQSYCPVASSAAVLNSLRGRIVLPQDDIYIPYPWATQHDLLDSKCFQDTVFHSPDGGYPLLYAGLGMDQAKQLLDCNLAGQKYDVIAHHIDPSTTTEDDVREGILEALLDSRARVFINYDRGGIGQGQLGHGHFSPIGAYNHEFDAFLIMDVAKYKHPPVWAPTSRLFGGIATVDRCSIFKYPDVRPDLSGKIDYAELSRMLGCQPAYRGYIIVKAHD